MRAPWGKGIEGMNIAKEYVEALWDDDLDNEEGGVFFSTWKLSYDMLTLDAITLMGLPFYIIDKATSPPHKMWSSQITLGRHGKLYNILRPALLSDAIKVLFHRKTNLVNAPPFTEGLFNLLTAMSVAPNGELQWYDFKRDVVYYLTQQYTEPDEKYNYLFVNSFDRLSALLRVATAKVIIITVTSEPYVKMCFPELIARDTGDQLLLRKWVGLGMKLSPPRQLMDVMDFGRLDITNPDRTKRWYAYIPVDKSQLSVADPQKTAELELLIFSNGVPDNDHPILFYDYHIVVKRTGHFYCDHNDTRRMLIKAITNFPVRANDSLPSTMAFVIGTVIGRENLVQDEFPVVNVKIGDIARSLNAIKWTIVPEKEHKEMIRLLEMPELEDAAIEVKQVAEVTAVRYAVEKLIYWRLHVNGNMSLFDMPIYRVFEIVPGGRDINVKKYEKDSGALVFFDDKRPSRVVDFIDREHLLRELGSRITRPEPFGRDKFGGVTEPPRKSAEQEYADDLFRAVDVIGPAEIMGIGIALVSAALEVEPFPQNTYQRLFIPQLSSEDVVHTASQGEFNTISLYPWYDMCMWPAIQINDKVKVDKKLKLLNILTLRTDILEAQDALGDESPEMDILPGKVRSYGRVGKNVYVYMPEADNRGVSTIANAMVVEDILRELQALNGKVRSNENENTILHVAVMPRLPTFIPPKKIKGLRNMAKKAGVDISKPSWQKAREIKE